MAMLSHAEDIKGIEIMEVTRNYQKETYSRILSCQ